MGWAGLGWLGSVRFGSVRVGDNEEGHLNAEAQIPPPGVAVSEVTGDRRGVDARCRVLAAVFKGEEGPGRIQASHACACVQCGAGGCVHGVCRVRGEKA